ncbi:MAG: WXG100 family type VII secretion target, partial [Chloroflexi bacterium]
DQVLQAVRRQIEDLQRDGWWGEGANAFYAEMEDEVLPGVKRLKTALDQAGDTTYRIIELMMDAEERAGGVFNGGGGLPDSGTGGGTAYPPPPPGIPRDRWDQLMNSGFYFKLAGDIFGSVNWVKALAALGIVVPEPATTGAGFGTLAVMTGISAILKYGEKFGEEPNLIRGGSIAMLDAIMGSAIDLTGVGTAIQLGNSIHQTYGGLEVAFSRSIAEFTNTSISPEMHDALFTTTQNYYDAMSKTDPTNIRYEVARLAYDLHSAPRQAVVNQLHEWGVPGADLLGSVTGTPVNSDFNLGTSVGRVWTATTDMFVGAVHYPETWVEMKMAQGVAIFNSAINHSPLPSDFKSAITETTDGAMSLLANTSVTDAALSLMPWNW